ncbi:hypothetical protein NQ176_g4122 [Zarea fungicola]|uniref:Uncharacterized protein n=1 Tax=Zarea fungicola TaxID=93591 RepID=A0ACC1NH16_9HYPO|nr:hypothetical protein NQ176_g4122 [Lecanicillium fungicola]
MHDRLCTVSAISPGAFTYLLPSPCKQQTVRDFAEKFAHEIALSDVQLTFEDVYWRVFTALEQLVKEMETLPLVDGFEMLPDSDWEPYLDFAYALSCLDDGDHEGPCSGRCTGLKTVTNAGEHNDFWNIVADVKTGAMLDFPADCTGKKGLLFHGELFEIVNGYGIRLDATTGLLDCISYGGVEKTCSQETMWLQQDFSEALDARMIHTKRAIQKGVPVDALKRAIARDFNCWQTKRPDSWPTCDPTVILPFTEFPSEGVASTLFDRLPSELLIAIFRPLPLGALLSFSTWSKSTRAIFKRVANLIIASMYKLGGDLRWILPVTTIKNEPERAEIAYRTWLPEDQSLAGSALSAEGFPHFDFIRACYGEEEDSMRNRRRLWNISKQFQGLWYEYRLRCKQAAQL